MLIHQLGWVLGMIGQVLLTLETAKETQKTKAKKGMTRAPCSGNPWNRAMPPCCPSFVNADYVLR